MLKQSHRVWKPFSRPECFNSLQISSTIKHCQLGELRLSLISRCLAYSLLC